MEAPIKTLATKDDLNKEISTVRKEASENKAEVIKWMFIFGVGQVAATMSIILLFAKNERFFTAVLAVITP